MSDSYLKQSTNLIKINLSTGLIGCILYSFSAALCQLNAQEIPDSAYLNWFDEQVGIENTALYEGVVYRESYRTINEKVKFFKSAKWYNGSIVYSDQEFHNVQLKYDVFGDQLILKQLDRLGGGVLLLIKSNISSFQIEETEFVNLKDAAVGSGISGFHELLWQESELRLLAKHRKKDFVRKDRSAAYHEFIDDKKLYLLDLNGQYHLINKKRELTDVFPELKKDIDGFYQKNKRLRTRNIDAFMVALARKLTELFQIENTVQTP